MRLFECVNTPEKGRPASNLCEKPGRLDSLTAFACVRKGNKFGRCLPANKPNGSAEDF